MKWRTILSKNPFVWLRACKQAQTVQRQVLFGAIHAVAGIAKAGNNIAQLIEVAVDGGCIDRNIGVGGLKIADAFGCREQAEEPDIARAALFRFLDRRDG